ncbi:hypothetical protein [Streptomyces chilikensis]|uniref:Uncharacterized protein n=1 Tax=Streptomyces chilikensis TaxID=1194079 RepID=A0ABV3EJ79_9ACTN
MPKRFDIQFTPSLPGKKALVGVATEEGFTWLVAEGHMSGQCREEMLEATRAVGFCQMWADLWAEQHEEDDAAPEPDLEAGAN